MTVADQQPSFKLHKGKDMSISQFYPQEVIASVATSTSFEEANLVLTTEEVTAIAEADLAQVEDGLDEIERVLRSAESAESVASVVTKVIEDDKELDGASISAINASFESIAVACEYPIVPKVETDDIKMSAEAMTDTVKDFAKNVYRATLALFAKIGDMLKKALNWIKDKSGVYDSKIKSLEESLKKAPNKPSNETFKVYKVPAQAVYVTALEGKSLVSGDKVSMGQLVDSIATMTKLAGAVPDTLKGVKVPSKVDEVDLEKPMIDPSTGALAAAAAMFKNAPDGYTVVSVRASGVTAIGVKEGKIDIMQVDEAAYKGTMDEAKKAESEAKYAVETADHAQLKALINGAKTSLKAYGKDSADATKQVKDLTKSIKDITNEVTKDKKDDKEAAKKAKAYFKEARSVVRLLPKSTMMHIDVVNLNLSLAASALAAYGDGAKEDEGDKKDEGDKSE